MILLALTIILFLFLSGVMAAVDAAVLSVTYPEIDLCGSATKPATSKRTKAK